MYLIEVPVEGGGRLVVQVSGEELPGDLQLAARPGEVVARAWQSLEQALDQIKPAVPAVLDRLVARSPDEVSVEFGLTLGAETGIVVTKGPARCAADVLADPTEPCSPAPPMPPCDCGTRPPGSCEQRCLRSRRAATRYSCPMAPTSSTAIRDVRSGGPSSCAASRPASSTHTTRRSGGFPPMPPYPANAPCSAYSVLR